MIRTAAAEKRDDQVRAGQAGAHATRKLSQGVRTLVARTKYEAPKVVSFPMDGLNVTAITMAGNL